MGNLPAVMTLAVCLASSAMAQPLALRPKGFTDLVQADFVFDNAVRKTRDLPTAALRAARREMIAGKDISATSLQALADAGDGLAAFRYAKLLGERAVPDPTGVAAHYYAIAAYTGRAFAVPPLASLLKDNGAAYSPSRLTHGLNAMTVQAFSGNPVAATLLGQMYVDGVPFGRDLDQARRFLDMASAGGSPKAVLQLAIVLMSDPVDAAAGHPGARSTLLLAAAGDDLAVRVTAENLLRLIDETPIPQPEVTQ